MKYRTSQTSKGTGDRILTEYRRTARTCKRVVLMPAVGLACRCRRVALPALLLLAALGAAHAADPPDDDDPWTPCETATIERADLKAAFRDNSHSPRVLSGIDALFNRHAAEFDAFDPDSPGASAGLNFEHIISGHASPDNLFAPRHHRYTLQRSPREAAVRLVRDASDDPWRMQSTLTYTLGERNSVDLDFRCKAHDPRLFGSREYAVLFFANYMNDVEQVALHFLGQDGPHDREHWIAADAPAGHADYNGGGTYRAAGAPALEYDAEHNFKLNLWSYDKPRFVRPFYFGRAAHGMTLIMMFDKSYSPRDEIRFSLFKFKVPKFPRPAFDWQYVIHHVRPDEQYGFRARLVWKPFVSAEDCQQEYDRWSRQLPAVKPTKESL